VRLYADRLQLLVWGFICQALSLLFLESLTACAWSIDREGEAGVGPIRPLCEQSEGSLPLGAKHCAATLYSVGFVSDPDHEAVNGFSSKAPRRRAHSVDGIGAMELFGSPPPRIATRGLLATVDPPRDDHAACSDHLPQRDARRDLADGDHPP